jgi:type IV secretory pathway VirB3-like protein
MVYSFFSAVFSNLTRNTHCTAVTIDTKTIVFALASDLHVHSMKLKLPAIFFLLSFIRRLICELKFALKSFLTWKHSLGEGKKRRKARNKSN